MAGPENLEEQQALAAKGAKPPKVVDARIPMPLGGLFTRSLDGWDVDANWLAQLAINDDKVLQLEGYAPDLAVYDGLLDDDVVFSTFQQRRLDVISRDWEVEPGADDAQSKAAADHLREQLKGIAWDDICDKMLHTRFYGYGVAEAMYEIGRDGLLRLQNIYVPNRAWFGFTNAGELRLRTHDNPDGEAVPPRKYWVARAGGSHDGQHYGVGLAHWCYWPVYFKKNGIRFWALFLEKFGMPTMLGRFPQGWEDDQEKLNDLLQALAAIGTDSAVVAPKDAEIEAMEGTRSGSGASSYDQFIDRMDTALTRVILTQTMTSTAEASGLGSSQAEVHQDKGLAIAQADSDLLHESFNNGPARWLTEWNFPGAAVPRVYRKLQDDDDLADLAERDAKLDALGWERTDESFRETYGEGYRRKAKPEPLALPAPGQVRPQLQTGNPRPPQNDNQRQQQAMDFAAQFAAHDPRPLYIQRKVVKGGQALLDWAAGQGFTDLVDLDDLHVTVVYSRAPVDWFELATNSGWVSERVEIPQGGPRAVELLGESSVVLHLASWELEHRHRELVEAGASHDFPSYWPHVTFAKPQEGLDLDAVQAFRGAIEFGPEIWEPLQDADPLLLDKPLVQFAAEQLDAIDRLTAALTAEGNKSVLAFVAPVQEALRGLGPDADPEQLRVACLEALEKLPTDQFAAVLADPLLAVQAAEETGEGADSVA